MKLSQSERLRVQENKSELPYATTESASTETSRRGSPLDPTPPTPSTKTHFYSNQQQPSFRQIKTANSELPPPPLEQDSTTSYTEEGTERPGTESQISHYQTPNSSMDDHDPYMRGYGPQEIKDAREEKEERVEKRAPAESMFIQVGEKQFHFDRLAFNVDDNANSVSPSHLVSCTSRN